MAATVAAVAVAAEKAKPTAEEENMAFTAKAALVLLAHQDAPAS